MVMLLLTFIAAGFGTILVMTGATRAGGGGVGTGLPGTWTLVIALVCSPCTESANATVIVTSVPANLLTVVLGTLYDVWGPGDVHDTPVFPLLRETVTSVGVYDVGAICQVIRIEPAL